MTNPQAARRSLRVSPAISCPRNSVTITIHSSTISPLGDARRALQRTKRGLKSTRAKWSKSSYVVIERTNERSVAYIRKTTSSKIASDCPWKVVLQRKVADGNKWSLSVKRLDHIGHIQSSNWLQHRQLRCFQQDEYDWIEQNHRIVKPRLLAELFERQFDREVRRQDIYNTIAKIRRLERGGYTEAQLFIRELKQPDIAWYNTKYITEPNRTRSYRHCAWIFNIQVDLWRRYPDCFSIDATYKTNNLNWSLILVVVVTPVKTVMPIFQALISNEGDEGYQWLTANLADALSKLEIRPPGVVLVDGDLQLGRAVAISFPQAHLQRCLFHKAQNIIDYIKKAWIRPALAYVLQEIREGNTATLNDDLPIDTDEVNEADEEPTSTLPAAAYRYDDEPSIRSRKRLQTRVQGCYYYGNTWHIPLARRISRLRGR